MWEKLDLAALYPFKGAYLLHLHLNEDQMFPIKSLKSPHLRAGDYLYCGSAFGSGGVGARVARHVRRDKKIHWHVDHLSVACGVKALHFFENQSECTLVARLIAGRFAEPAYPGFGSSDCRKCSAHLLRRLGTGGLDFTDGIFLSRPS